MSDTDDVPTFAATLDMEIDAQLVRARLYDASELQLTLIDKVFRPYQHLLEANRAAESNVLEFINATAWLCATISMETVLNTVADSSSDAVLNGSNELMRAFHQHLQEITAMHLGKMSNPH